MNSQKKKAGCWKAYRMKKAKGLAAKFFTLKADKN
jgi:hypothetical protein